MEDTELRETLFNSLNEQGFIFQEKCAEVINQSATTGWHLHTTEHPVSLKDKDIRIDVIIRDETLSQSSLFGVIECKRVDPRYSCWLFGKPLYDVPVPANAQIIKMSPSNRAAVNILRDEMRFVPIRAHFNVHAFYIDNWWVEVNIQEDRPPNKRLSNPEPLERVFIQVCRGVGGLVTEQKRQRTKTLRDLDEDDTDEFEDLTSETYFVPIVITTAPLYVASYDLSDVGIVNGTLGRNSINFMGSPLSPEPVRWVMIDYGAAASVTPDELYYNFHGVDPVDLEPYNRRSIFVVNSDYINDFLTNLHLSDQ